MRSKAVGGASRHVDLVRRRVGNDAGSGAKAELRHIAGVGVVVQVEAFLLLGDLHDLWYFSNSSTVGDSGPQQLQPGIYGLSNARLDTPWPKVTLGKEKLAAMGRLTSQIAHELNNPLTSIIGFAHLLQQADLDEIERIDVRIALAHRAPQNGIVIQQFLLTG